MKSLRNKIGGISNRRALRLFYILIGIFALVTGIGGFRMAGDANARVSAVANVFLVTSGALVPLLIPYAWKKKLCTVGWTGVIGVGLILLVVLGVVFLFGGPAFEFLLGLILNALVMEADAAIQQVKDMEAQKEEAEKDKAENR